MRKPYTVLLVLIFLLGLILRLYRFDFPIADWHSWRQTDTSAVSRIFAEKGFDILHPKYLDISNIQTGVNNPEGLRFVEFPLYNIFQAGTFKYIGVLTIEEWGRVVAIVSSLLTGLFLYLLAKEYFGKRTAFFSLIFYLFLPFSIYYGRTILPDTTMIMTSFGGIYFFSRYIREKSNKKYLFLILSSILTSSAILLKPYAVFFVLPQLYLAVDKYRNRFLLKIELWLHLILSILPFMLWRIWISNFPEGIPASSWLLNGNGIRFRPAFFRWILYERLAKLILGYFGILFIFFGFLNLRKSKKYLFALSFLASSIIYVVVFATGNVQHDYYQILIIPSIALIAGFGLDYLFSKGRIYQFLSICILLLSFFISMNQVKDYFNINNEAIVIAGRRANEILPIEAKVIAPYDGDTTFLYYINRKGWPAFQSSVEELKHLGAKNDINGFGKMYEVVELRREYLILKL